MCRWILFVLALTSACNHQPDTRREQVQLALDSQKTPKPVIGHIARDFGAVRGYEVAINPRYADRKSPSDQWKRVLVYQGLRDDLLCFGFTYGRVSDRGDDETLAAYAKAFKTVMVHIETRESLDTIRDNTRWPEHVVSDARSVRVVEHWDDQRSAYDATDGSTHWLTTVNASIEVCGVKPDTSTTMHYLLITVFPNGSGSTDAANNSFFKDALGFEDSGRDSDTTPAEFIWAIDG